MKNSVKLKGRMKSYLQSSLYLGFLLVAVDILIYFIDIRAGLVLSCFIIFYLAIILSLMFYNKPIIINELISFATQYGQIQRRLLRDLDLPHALLDENGKIIWTNIAFEKAVDKEKGYRKSITSLFPSITKDRLPGSIEEEEVEFDVDFEERNYIARLKKISLKEMAENSDIIEAKDYDGYLIALYLFDETALKIALQEVDDQSLAVGLIYLDNYEEALESIEEVRRSLLIALIDRKVNKYIAALDGICRKMEKDKYLVIMKKKSVSLLQENRFDLLEDVKTVNIGNEMAVTISIGVGLSGLTYAQNYEFARNAIDLALGRGGDQAVMKMPENVIYYGGKSQQVEKNTRVKARVKAHALRELLETKDRLLIMGHKIGDIDSFGSAIGMYRIAVALNKKANIVINEVTSSVRPMMDRFVNSSDYPEDLFLNGEEAAEIADASTALVVVDVNRPSYTEEPQLLKLVKTIVVIDHHRQSSEIISNATLSYVEPYASSACELVAEILQYVADSIRIKSAEAEAMYAGIVIDTNNFKNQAGVRTFEAAAFLRRNGADVTRIRKMLRDKMEDYKARAEAVRQAEVFEGDFAISICPSEGVESPTVVGAQAANELLNIVGIKASIVLTAYEGKIYVSARSIDEVNVQVMMEKMGGGGHRTIAGAQLSGVTVEEAKEKIKEIIREMKEKGEI